MKTVTLPLEEYNELLLYKSVVDNNLEDEGLMLSRGYVKTSFEIEEKKKFKMIDECFEYVFKCLETEPEVFLEKHPHLVKVEKLTLSQHLNILLGRFKRKV